MGFVGPERGPLVNDLGVKLTDRGNVWRDERWMTSVPGVFAAGDMQRGQSLIVWAIAEGRSAARGIDQYLMGESTLPAPLSSIHPTSPMHGRRVSSETSPSRCLSVRATSRTSTVIIAPCPFATS